MHAVLTRCGAARQTRRGTGGDVPGFDLACHMTVGYVVTTSCGGRQVADRLDAWTDLVDGALMIPILIVCGVVLGRWWPVPLVAAAVGWPILLVATGFMTVEPALAGASGLAVLNTAVGVLIHQGVLRVVRWVRPHTRPFLSGLRRRVRRKMT